MSVKHVVASVEEGRSPAIRPIHPAGVIRIVSRMPTSESVRAQRRATCVAHMTDENAHAFDRCIAAFEHPRYEIVPTGEVYDGTQRVHALMLENKTAFPDFYFAVEQIHDAEDAVIVEGTFKGTHNGTWRGLPATGRKVLLPMAIIFRFNGAGMISERVFFDSVLCFDNSAWPTIQTRRWGKSVPP